MHMTISPLTVCIPPTILSVLINPCACASLPHRFRSEWKMYALHTDIIVFLVDTQQPYDIYLSKRELHVILEQLQRPTPILVLANKIDLGPQISQEEIIEGLNLDYIHDHPWLVIPVSAKSGENVNQALDFMLKYAK